MWLWIICSPSFFLGHTTSQKKKMRCQSHCLTPQAVIARKKRKRREFSHEGSLWRTNWWSRRYYVLRNVTAEIVSVGSFYAHFTCVRKKRDRWKSTMFLTCLYIFFNGTSLKNLKTAYIHTILFGLRKWRFWIRFGKWLSCENWELARVQIPSENNTIESLHNLLHCGTKKIIATSLFCLVCFAGFQSNITETEYRHKLK